MGVTVRYARVPRVKMGLFVKWELGEVVVGEEGEARVGRWGGRETQATQIHSSCLINGDLSYQ